MNVSSSLSGIQTSITRHDITAHDVANVNTPGFKQRTAHQAETSPRGVRISRITHTPDSSAASSNTSLIEESKEQIQNKNTLSANTSVLKVKDRMIGELLDIFG
ncbi:MAG: flagellar basal body rod protein [Chitinivibrionales bacterium]|nr:flagellar basal body rod protein [Chitinivibrionales bacterium]